MNEFEVTKALRTLANMFPEEQIKEEINIEDEILLDFYAFCGTTPYFRKEKSLFFYKKIKEYVADKDLKTYLNLLHVFTFDIYDFLVEENGHDCIKENVDAKYKDINVLEFGDEIDKDFLNNLLDTIYSYYENNNLDSVIHLNCLIMFI